MAVADLALLKEGGTGIGAILRVVKSTRVCSNEELFTSVLRGVRLKLALGVLLVDKDSLSHSSSSDWMRLIV